MAAEARARVLIVAGSDSGGGAGIQADVKTVTALGADAATAITALTVQNTLGVTGVMEAPTDFIAEQMRVVFDRYGPQGVGALKSGMLHSVEVIDTVADALRDLSVALPFVLDPVMVAKGGARLLREDAAQALIDRLLPRATVVTPNLPEAEVLTGSAITSLDDMIRAGRLLRGQGASAALVKGGHLDGDRLHDVLVCAEGVAVFEDTRLQTRHTHGTGCTTASAIAAGLARGLSLVDAVARARAYVRAAMETAPGLGSGHGPLNHAHPLRAERSALSHFPSPQG